MLRSRLLHQLALLSLSLLFAGSVPWPTDVFDLRFVYEAPDAKEGAKLLRAFKAERGVSDKHRPALLS